MSERLRDAIDHALEIIDDPTRYVEVHPMYRAGWVDALRAIRDETAPSLGDGPWQQLSDAATAGPWEATTSPGFVTGHIRADGRNIADMRYRNGHADAALIVAAVNAVRRRLGGAS